MTENAAPLVDSGIVKVDTSNDADEMKKAFKARDEAKARARELEKQNEELMAFRKQIEDERMTEAEKTSARIAELEAKASKVDLYESTITETLTAKLAAIPEERRGLIPDSLTPAEQLRYIAKNEALLVGKPVPSPVSLTSGTPPSKPAPAPAGSLTAAEKKVARGFGMTDDEYLACKVSRNIRVGEDG